MLAYVLTLGRLPLAACFAALIAMLTDGGHVSNGVAIGLIVVAIVEELTDIFDGWAARRFGTVTRLGGILDPLVDSLSRGAIYFAMAFAGWITLAVPLVMVARDIIVAYTRIANASIGAATSARFSGKFKAIIQGGAIPVVVVLAAPAALDSLGSGAVDALRLVVAGILIVVTVWSMIDYIIGAWPAVRRMKNS
ncbi:MAG: CDP-alcohol phosphatidyltransferase family protein [Phycisphaerae bacterium]|jgi:CDP-diacylglycerol--glycerol-3-phosphate 3-phosphatidyltransferase|nr:CDP-alcohol phosphatidyltransferase family protein [Phycisphaerae bacterium]